MKLVRRILSSINQSSWFWGFGSFEALTSVRVEFGIIIIVQHRIIFIRVARHFFLKNFFDFPRMNSVTNCCSWLALIELRKLISWNHRTIGLCLELGIKQFHTEKTGWEECIGWDSHRVFFWTDHNWQNELRFTFVFVSSSAESFFRYFSVPFMLNGTDIFATFAGYNWLQRRVIVCFFVKIGQNHNSARNDKEIIRATYHNWFNFSKCLFLNSKFILVRWMRTGYHSLVHP